MQNGQTEPKVYIDTPQALFVHSKKLLKKEKPIPTRLFYNTIITFYILFFAVGAIFTSPQLCRNLNIQISLHSYPDL